ncbi:hypothetical protein K439DRAFT_1621800 [Ramaria rubella]|nr:hypothetical protein K439DRAFT_1621800 [Ramaria rubella]
MASRTFVKFYLTSCFSWSYGGDQPPIVVDMPDVTVVIRKVSFCLSSLVAIWIQIRYLEVFQKHFLFFVVLEVEVERRIGHGDKRHASRSKDELQLVNRLLYSRRSTILPKDITLELCSSRVGIKLINSFNRNGRRTLTTIRGRMHWVTV